jgi:hypothetical protein
MKLPPSSKRAPLPVAVSKISCPPNFELVLEWVPEGATLLQLQRARDLQKTADCMSREVPARFGLGRAPFAQTVPPLRWWVNGWLYEPSL